MLKIRCTDVQQPGYDYSQLTENQKAKFQTPYIPNEERNYVEHKSVNKIPSDIVSQTKSQKEITEDVHAPAEDVPAPAPTLETVEE